MNNLRTSSEAGNVTFMVIMFVMLGFIMAEITLEVGSLTLATAQVSHAAQAAAHAGAAAYERTMIKEAKALFDENHPTSVPGEPTPTATPTPDPANPEEAHVFTQDEINELQTKSRDAGKSAVESVVENSGADVVSLKVDEKHVQVTTRISYKPFTHGLFKVTEIVRSADAKINYKQP